MNTINDIELDNMRQQMRILKEKLDKEQIVNDRLVRQSMRRSASSIYRLYIVISVLGLLMIPYSYWAFVSLTGLSITFWLGTCLLMIVSVGATIYNGRDLRDPDLMTGNLLETRHKMARAKKFDSQWLIFGIPAALLWACWFGWEVICVKGDGELYPLLYGGGVGLLVGLAIGLRLHFKTQRQYQDIIDQIEDVEEV